MQSVPLQFDYASARPASAGGRDLRLDFWRGLCLIDMVIVHLAFADVWFGNFLTPVFQYYLRFAAGGFVMISGFCVGAIFFPRVLAAGNDHRARWTVYKRIWRRAMQVLLIQYAVAGIWILLIVWRQSLDPGMDQERNPNIGVLQTLWNIARLCEGGDLLPLYVYMLALTPLLMGLVRRRLGWLVMIASLLVFMVGMRHPYWLALSVPAAGDPGRGRFPPLLWQLVFITGLLAPPVLRAFDRLSLGRKLAITAGALVIAVLVFFDANWGNMEMSRNPVALIFHDTLVYRKIPLTFGEYLRYLTLMVMIILSTTLGWRYIAKSRAVAFSALLGRYSLLIYVCHLFLQEIIMAVVYKFHPESIWWGLSAPLAIGILGLIAWSVEAKNKRQHRAPKAGPPAFPVTAMPVTAMPVTAMPVTAIPESTPLVT